MNDSWAWMIDGDAVHTKLDVERLNAHRSGHPATNAAIGIALRLRLEGAPQEALRELARADGNADALLLTGQILFEMERFEEAAKSYSKLAKNFPEHPFASFNHSVAGRLCHCARTLPGSTGCRSTEAASRSTIRWNRSG